MLVQANGEAHAPLLQKLQDLDCGLRGASNSKRSGGCSASNVGAHGRAPDQRLDVLVGKRLEDVSFEVELMSAQHTRMGERLLMMLVLGLSCTN